MFKKVAIVGVGLIGGSIGLEIKRMRLAKRVVGFGRSKVNLRVALRRGIIDGASTHLPQAVDGADFVVLSSPVKAIEKHLEVLARTVPAGTIVMDVGSTKQAILKKASAVLSQHQYFVGAHPMAGTERGGAGAALNGLFRNRICLLTPRPGTPRRVVSRVREFWKKMGARVHRCAADRHDTLLAYTSHLPHICAYVLVTTVKGPVPMSEIRRLAGGGLFDTTRIAASPSEMWRDICLANAPSIGKSLARYQRQLSKIGRLIQHGKGAPLKRYFENAARVRRGIFHNQ